MSQDPVVDDLRKAMLIIFEESLSERNYSPASRQEVERRKREFIDDLVKKGNVRRMRSAMQSMFSDLTHSVRPSVFQGILTRILSETHLKMGELSGLHEKVVRAIQKRGEIRTEDEYRHMRAYLDDLEAQGADEASILPIIAMLDSHDSKSKK